MLCLSRMYYAVNLLLVVFIIILWQRRQEEISYKCFLLTLKDDKERHNVFIENHDKTIPLEVIYGKDTRHPRDAMRYKNIIEPEYYKKAMKLYYNPDMIRPDITYFNLGAIGCYVGHLEFHKRCHEQGLKYAVIFEDNVVVKTKQLYEEIQNVIERKGDNFEMCFFHCLSRFPEKIEQGDLEKVRWISSTKCYLVHVPNMKKYVDYFLPMDNHIDMKHEDLIAKGARVYYKDLRHCMIIDRTHKSTIGHSDHGNKKFFSKQYPKITTHVLRRGY